MRYGPVTDHLSVSTPAAVADKAKHIASGPDSAADHKNGEPTSTEQGDPQARTGPSLANAAKELRHRAGLQSGTGTSTPDFVRTAAEVADSAALLDKEDKDDEGPTVANAAKRLMHRLDPHAGSDAGSGASTPSFVKTTTEVADSAALLDNEDADPEVTDEEAGRTGFRRMSLTPIQDVAATAAEVADSAKGLDSDVSPRSPPLDLSVLTTPSRRLDLKYVLLSTMIWTLTALTSHQFPTITPLCSRMNVWE